MICWSYFPLFLINSFIFSLNSFFRVFSKNSFIIINFYTLKVTQEKVLVSLQRNKKELITHIISDSYTLQRKSGAEFWYLQIVKSFTASCFKDIWIRNIASSKCSVFLQRMFSYFYWFNQTLLKQLILN